MWDLRGAAEAIGAEFLRPKEPFAASGASADSRRVRPGDLFLALPGRYHNGHDFLREAFDQGAVGALVSRDPGVGHNLMRVADTKAALWELARWRREAIPVPFVAVTGSIGKTTTKELLAQALSARYRVFRAPENYNTELGVPLAILSIPDEAEMVVLELGMTAKGEIAHLCELVSPWAGIITGVGPAHLANLGSVDQVAEAKWELAMALPEEGILAVGWDFPELRARAERCEGLCLRFGRTPEADFFPRDVVADDPTGVRFHAVTPGGETRTQLGLLGEHVAVLACGALALAWAMGVPEAIAARAMGELPPLPHRLELRPAPFGWILDDCYNANPLSVQAALFTLSTLKLPVERRVALLGDMLDLGPNEARYHQEMMDTAQWAKVDALFAFGERATAAFSHWNGPGAAEDKNLEALLAKVRAEAAKGPTLLLIKGSRAMALERAVKALSQ